MVFRSLGSFLAKANAVINESLVYIANSLLRHRWKSFQLISVQYADRMEIGFIETIHNTAALCPGYNGLVCHSQCIYNACLSQFGDHTNGEEERYGHWQFTL
ncbi:unnamed protein product [Pieris brassicae]|uniref:Uncharacterized protein n=1 Tax=Pieris brassicae TaxID=7116 RepID=A0A9P0TBG3_PIEBR|nr:unnamed protein product [Pieris brassicae]